MCQKTRLTQAVLPLDNIGDQQNGQSQQRSSHSIDANGASKDPQAHSDGKGTGCDLLIQGEGPQLLQLLLGLLGGIRSVLHLCITLPYIVMLDKPYGAEVRAISGLAMRQLELC